MNLVPRLLLFIVSCTIFVAALVWPAAALIWTSIQQWAAPRSGFLFSSSLLLLLMKSVLLSAAAAGLGLLLALASLFVSGFQKYPPLLIAVWVAGLLCPPMVFAFGWLRLLPAYLDPQVRCVLTWALWAWPIAAIILSAYLTRRGRTLFEAGQLETSTLALGVHLMVPVLRPFALLAFLVLFVLFFGDYGVPHTFGLHVFATELLAWAGESDHTIDGLWPALLPVTVTAILLGAILSMTNRCTSGEDDEPTNPAANHERVRNSALLVPAMLGSGLPLLGLCKPLTAGVFGEAVQTYSGDVLASFGVAVCSTVLVLVMGLGIPGSLRFRNSVLFFALMFGALPGAVVGQALIAAYNNAALGFIYDHWSIVCLAYAARYAWIGFLACGHIARSRTSLQADQARTDGASEIQVFLRILVPQNAPWLLGVGAVIVALAMGDLATSSMVRVPAYSPIASVIIEKFHRLEDGMLISLSLILLVFAGFGAALVAWANQYLERQRDCPV